MPAKIKVRCKYADCKFNQDYVCMNTEIELFPDQDCAMYEPVEVVAEEEDPEEDDELQEEEELERALGGLDERFHLLGVLLPGRRLDAAGDVDRVGADLADGVGDVGGRQSPGKNNRPAELSRMAGQFPIETLARPARLARHVAIQQPGRDIVMGQSGQRGGIAHAERFDNR